MKRRILLLMMTVLLSVGAWAENVWTGEVTPGWYQGEGDEGECNHFGVVGFTANRRLMRGDYIVVTATTSNKWYNEIKVCKVKDSGYWAGDVLATVSNYDFESNSSKLYIRVSDDIVSALNSETAPQYTLYFDGHDYTMTSVDVVYNQGKANLFYSESGQSRRYWGGQLLDPALFAVASVGDIVTIDISRVGNNDDPVVVNEWGENVTIYNKCPMSVWNAETESNEDPEGLAELTTLKVFTAPTTLSLVLTEELLANAKENGLSLGGGNYNFTSVDLLYKPTVSINAEAGYATLGYAAALDLTDIDAYTVSVSGDKAQLTSVKGKKIPAGTGIILKGSGDVTIPLTTEATDDITGNDLKVSDGTVPGGSSIYVLADGKYGVGFYRLDNSETVPAGKAYLEVTGASSTRGFIGFGDDDTTVISNVKSVVEDNVYYDLLGRRVDQPSKGLYIHNGKKVVIK